MNVLLSRPIFKDNRPVEPFECENSIWAQIRPCLLSNGNFQLSQKSFQFLDLNGNSDVKYVYLVLLSEYINAVWYFRNEIKVNERNCIPIDLMHRFFLPKLNLKLLSNLTD